MIHDRLCPQFYGRSDVECTCPTFTQADIDAALKKQREACADAGFQWAYDNPSDRAHNFHKIKTAILNATIEGDKP